MVQGLLERRSKNNMRPGLLFQRPLHLLYTLREMNAFFKAVIKQLV